MVETVDSVVASDVSAVVGETLDVAVAVKTLHEVLLNEGVSFNSTAESCCYSCAVKILPGLSKKMILLINHLLSVDIRAVEIS